MGTGLDVAVGDTSVNVGVGDTGLAVAVGSGVKVWLRVGDGSGGGVGCSAINGTDVSSSTAAVVAVGNCARACPPQAASNKIKLGIKPNTKICLTETNCRPPRVRNLKFTITNKNELWMKIRQ